MWMLFASLVSSSFAAPGWVGPLSGHEMVRVDGASVVLGRQVSPVGVGPSVQVTLTRDIWVGELEVTQALWTEVMPKYSPWQGRACHAVDVQGPSLPAVCLSWFDAVRFANALSEHHGLERAYRLRGRRVRVDLDATGYRLPTEAEWESAARWGSSYQEFRGTEEVDLLCEFGNYADLDSATGVPMSVACSDGFDLAAPVGRFPATVLGLRDVGGNVREWTWDRVSVPLAGQLVDPMGPERGSSRSARGASWRSSRSPSLARRHSLAPSERQADLGVRLVRTAADGSEPSDDYPMRLLAAGVHHVGELRPGRVRRRERMMRLRGRRASSSKRNRPPSKVEPFFVGRVEVTQELWTRVVGSNPVQGARCRRSWEIKDWNWTDPISRPGRLLRRNRGQGVRMVGEQLPVVCVTFPMAATFANALSRIDGLTPVYDDRGPVIVRTGGDGYRLPTELERAVLDAAWPARAGVRSICETANVLDYSATMARTPWEYNTYSACDDGFAALAEVGQLQPNALGLYDLHGNAAELVQHPEEPQRTGGHPADLGAAAYGGSWSSDPMRPFDAFRPSRKPDRRVGLRLVRDAP